MRVRRVIGTPNAQKTFPAEYAFHFQNMFIFTA
jgi:hypothetical protein